MMRVQTSNLNMKELENRTAALTFFLFFYPKCSWVHDPLPKLTFLSEFKKFVLNFRYFDLVTATRFYAAN